MILVTLIDLCVSGVMYTAVYRLWGWPIALSCFATALASAVAKQANKD